MSVFEILASISYVKKTQDATLDNNHDHQYHQQQGDGQFQSFNIVDDQPLGMINPNHGFLVNDPRGFPDLQFTGYDNIPVAPMQQQYVDHNIINPTPRHVPHPAPRPRPSQQTVVKGHHHNNQLTVYTKNSASADFKRRNAYLNDPTYLKYSSQQFRCNKTSQSKK